MSDVIIPATDTDFEDEVIDRVEKHARGGWTICYGVTCFGAVPADSPVEPQPGMVARFYGGAGAGSRIRGLALNGTPIFYRTKAEDRELADIQLYGADCADLIARWDRGDIIHTIEMGGMGPGYEQCIQITMIEILRHFVATKPDAALWQDKDIWAQVRDEADKAVSPRVKYIGLSGAQWGAAMSLAAKFYTVGPRAIMADPQVKDRRIMASREIPQAPAAPAVA